MAQKEAKILTPEKNRGAGGTPYDDVFRTLVSDCHRLVIPVINELFSEHFSPDAHIEFDRDIHMLNRQNGDMSKRITDSCFTIKGTKRKRFLLESQSTEDNSMLIRIFEYASQIALDEGKSGKYSLRVQIPGSAVLFLRGHKRNRPDMGIAIVSPEEKILNLKVKVLYLQDYTLDKIFKKNLLLLIPFYIFNYEAWLKRYENSLLQNQEILRENQEVLLEDYRRIRQHLDELQLQEKITAYAKMLIVEMTNKVVESLVWKHPDIVGEVKSIMGGQILEYESKTIFREGQREGELKNAKAVVLSMHELGFTEDTISKVVKLDVSQIHQWITENEKHL